MNQVLSRTEREATIAGARSFLFVPGDRADRFDKAAESGADIIILDLEDAVSLDRKEHARGLVSDWLSSGGRAIVRLNSADTPWFVGDADLCRHPSLIGAIVSKADAGRALEQIGETCPTIALIESARAIRHLDAIASTAGVVRLALGSIDLALDLGFTAPDEALDPLRLALVVSSRAAAIAPPIAGVTIDFRDTARVLSDTRREAALGFAAKLCIHPAQISPIHEALRPDPVEVERARKIIEAFDAASGGAVAIDGRMLDKPVVERARRLVASSCLADQRK